MLKHEISVPAGLQTVCFVLAPGALDELPELVKTKFQGRKPWIIADENTWNAAGYKAKKFFADAQTEMYPEKIFPASPRLHPEFTISERLALEMPSDCVPVAVGSGVINDLVKCAQGMKNIRYCCVPTACSVDGYTSAGAAMVKNGTKNTVKCPAPYAICADTELLATAPAPMLASGFADLLTKIPAGADWIIADELNEQPIRNDVWELIQGHIREWTSDRHNLLNIFAGLAATGYSMQMMLDSRPASGAEHLFSHIWEMEGLSLNGEDVSHGFKVGIGLITSTLLMEFVLEHDYEELVPFMKAPLSREEREKEIAMLTIRGCYGTEPHDTAMKKWKNSAEIYQRREEIGKHWKNLQIRLKKQIVPSNELRKMLNDAGCPIFPSEIGLSNEQFLHAVPAAQLIRIRYTVLDFLYELGLLETAMNEKLSSMLRK